MSGLMPDNIVAFTVDGREYTSFEAFEREMMEGQSWAWCFRYRVAQKMTLWLARWMT